MQLENHLMVENKKVVNEEIYSIGMAEMNEVEI
jgi:hypothetical protein